MVGYSFLAEVTSNSTLSTTLRLDSQEVNINALYCCFELWEFIKFGLLPFPVIRSPPIPCNLFHFSTQTTKVYAGYFLEKISHQCYRLNLGTDLCKVQGVTYIAGVTHSSSH